VVVLFSWTTDGVDAETEGTEEEDEDEDEDEAGVGVEGGRACEGEETLEGGVVFTTRLRFAS